MPRISRHIAEISKFLLVDYYRMSEICHNWRTTSKYARWRLYTRPSSGERARGQGAGMCFPTRSTGLQLRTVDIGSRNATQVDLRERQMWVLSSRRLTRWTSDTQQSSPRRLSVLGLIVSPLNPAVHLELRITLKLRHPPYVLETSAMSSQAHCNRGRPHVALCIPPFLFFSFFNYYYYPLLIHRCRSSFVSMRQTALVCSPYATCR